MKKPPAMGGFRIELRSCRHVQCTQKWFKSGLNWFKFRLVQSPNPLSPSTSSVDGLHRREEEDVADGVGVGEQHDQAIHAEAKAAGRGQDGPFGSIRGRNLLCRRDFQVSLERCGCSSLPVFTLLAEGDGAGNRSRQKPRKA